MSGGSIVPTRLGAALALLTVGGLLAIVQIIVSAGASTGRSRPAPAHERHLGLDAGERKIPLVLQTTASSTADQQEPPPTPVPPADVVATPPPPLLPLTATASDIATPQSSSLSLAIGAPNATTASGSDLKPEMLGQSDPQPPANLSIRTAESVASAPVFQAVRARCLPKPSNKDKTYTIVRVGVDSNDPTTAPRGPVGSSCSDNRRGFVAMVTPCTSRKANFRTVARSPFAKSFLPSAVETLARSVDAGLDVVFYVGYDAGDTVWDTDAARAEAPKLAEKLLDGPSAKHLPPTISVGFRMVRCNSNNMVAASNCAVEAAYTDGASYWYRLNDDTLMVTPNWLRDMPGALADFSPPNIGVVGPICKQGNTAILTYDFVHRSHWEIFKYQYPATLQNWWCDNWVSTVYGPARTLRHASQEVRHLLTGTRYNVYRSDPQTHKSVPDSLLPAALNEGACLIDAFLDNLPGEAGITEVVHTRQVNGAPVMTGKPTSRATVRCRPD